MSRQPRPQPLLRLCRIDPCESRRVLTPVAPGIADGDSAYQATENLSPAFPLGLALEENSFGTHLTFSAQMARVGTQMLLIAPASESRWAVSFGEVVAQQPTWIRTQDADRVLVPEAEALRVAILVKGQTSYVEFGADDSVPATDTFSLEELMFEPGLTLLATGPLVPALETSPLLSFAANRALMAVQRATDAVAQPILGLVIEAEAEAGDSTAPLTIGAFVVLEKDGAEENGEQAQDSSAQGQANPASTFAASSSPVSGDMLAAMAAMFEDMIDMLHPDQKRDKLTDPEPLSELELLMQTEKPEAPTEAPAPAPANGTLAHDHLFGSTSWSSGRVPAQDSPAEDSAEPDAPGIQPNEDLLRPMPDSPHQGRVDKDVLPEPSQPAPPETEAPAAPAQGEKKARVPARSEQPVAPPAVLGTPIPGAPAVIPLPSPRQVESLKAALPQGQTPTSGHAANDGTSDAGEEMPEQ